MLKFTKHFVTVSTFCLAAAVAAPAASQGRIEDVGASERINFSGKLRMLSQRIPAAACYAHVDVETEASTKLLAAATAEFDLIIDGLEKGEDSLGIRGVEDNRKVLRDIAIVNEHWEPLHSDITHVYDNGGSDDDILHLAKESGPLLGAAKNLVSVLVGVYSDPTALLQADAITIDIAGRQRMLAQRISKNFCLAANGYLVDQALKELGGARETYDASANALRYGMPAAGIHQTSNPEILAGLDKVLADWASVQPILDSVAAGENISKENQAKIYNTMNSLTGQMNTLVGMFNDDSKLGL